MVHILRHGGGKFNKKEVRELFGRSLSNYLVSHESEIDQLRRQTSSEGTREFAAYGIIAALARDVVGFADGYLREHHKDRENQEPYKVLRRIEESLRKSISDSLSLVTNNWWKERIPTDVRESAELRKKQDESPWPWMEGKRFPAYSYINFSEYSKIILKRDNWREAFGSIFENEEWVSVIFRELERVRNDVAHNRDLSERQLTVLKLYSDDLTRVLSSSKPELEVQVAREVGAPLVSNEVSVGN